MAGRFPGAPDLDRFWSNLRRGVESISFLSEGELLESGVDPALLDDPSYVRAAPILKDADRFDASFFGISPREARVMDPQQRLFLECAWHALEHAGYPPERLPGLTGVFAGAAACTYWLASRRFPPFGDDYLLALVGNDKDFLATRVAHQLDLRGPAIGVQTACSTSLVAVHLACQSLLHRECDMALAGGVSVRVPHVVGHVHRPGSVFTPDGHCRAFDADAAGTLFGSGLGIVVLRRLEDAVADRDRIHAVILGSAVNNDGSSKADYMAPSIESQAEVVVEALANARVRADAISYVEAHGTGTRLGDPIEVEALTRAFRLDTRRQAYCALGSVKTNVGHLDAASGIAGLIKTVLALEHRMIPPSLHYRRPNPAIDFASSPFYVNARLADWWVEAGPRRAGVHCLGIGGTNAHVVLEEPPAPPPSGPSRPHHVLLLSARTPRALDALRADLAVHLEAEAGSIADVAYTLAVGRQTFEHRRVLVCESSTDAAQALADPDSPSVLAHHETRRHRPVVFLFPGAGALYPGMARGLYEDEPPFRQQVDRALAQLGADEREALSRVLLARGSSDALSADLRRPSVQLPLLFVLEAAQSDLLRSWGIEPVAAIGHSMGEYAAAYVAGVLGFDDGLALVRLRGGLFEAVAPGGMLSVALPEADAIAWLGDELDLACVNGPRDCVISGPIHALTALAEELSSAGVPFDRVPIETAAHSRLLDPCLAEFRAGLEKFVLAPPRIPFLSNLTGTWVTPEQATDPEYWVQQLRRTVRLGDGLTELSKDPGRVFVELGPPHMRSALLGPQSAERLDYVHTLRHARDPSPDRAVLLGAAGRLWQLGVEVDWDRLYQGEDRCRAAIPGYPFEPTRYWFEPGVEARGLRRAVRRVGRWSGASRLWRRVRGLAHRVTASSVGASRSPRPDAAPDGPAHGVDPDRERIEGRLAGIWREVLGAEHVEREDDFFVLGGNSLQLLTALGWIRQIYGVELSVLDFLETPTVAGLARRIQGGGRTPAPSPQARRSRSNECSVA